MGFREEFRATSNSRSPSSSSATQDEFRPPTARERLSQLQQAYRQSLEDGARRVAEEEHDEAEVLEAELIYQAEFIGPQKQIGSGQDEEETEESLVVAIQQITDYFGSALSEVRWSVERQLESTEQLLKVQLESLDNASRQYFEQGVKCYEAGEYELARERFNRALESDRTNYFAWQYLGFIAVAEDQADEAIRAFDLARKFARNEQQQAQALTHLARSYHATQNDAIAADLARAATEACPDNPRYWYDLAASSARLELRKQAIAALREAIERDWTYWGIAVNDVDFEPLRQDVIQLLNDLREREQEKSCLQLERLRYAIETAQAAGAGAQLGDCRNALERFEQELEQRNVFIQRDLATRIQQWHEKAFQLAEATLEKRISEKEITISRLEESARRREEEIKAQKQMRPGKFSAQANDNDKHTGGLKTIGRLFGLHSDAWRHGYQADKTQQVKVDYHKALESLHKEQEALKELLAQCRRREYVQLKT